MKPTNAERASTMKDNDEPPSSVVSLSKYLRNAPSPPAEDAKDAADTYQEARARSREAFMLELRFTDGTLVSFDYSHLAKSKFLPEGKIVLRFGRDEVTAEGKNLRRLYSTITEHRQRFIEEGTDEEEKHKSEDAHHIDKIAIREDIEES
jgi:hypothetical protein